MTVEKIETVETIKEEMMKIVEKYKACTMVEIENHLSRQGISYQGEYAINHPHYENISLWYQWNYETAQAFKELIKEGKIGFKGCDVLLYLIDGKCYRVPIAKKPMNYKKERWLPVEVLDMKHYK